MNFKGKGIGLVALALVLFGTPVFASDRNADSQMAGTDAGGTGEETGAEVAKKYGLVKKDGCYYYYDKEGKRLKNRWKTINGRRYYFNNKGRALIGGNIINKRVYVFSATGKLYQPKKPRFVTVKENRYYVDTRGRASTGWFVVNNRLCYGDPKGRLYLKNRSREGITFTKDGYAVSTSAANAKVLSMTVLSRITTENMTNAQKLSCAWNWVVSNISYASYYPSGRAGWQKEMAAIALGQRVGNCYGYACAFAALAHEIGYDPYLVCGRVTGTRDGAGDGLTRHCWVQINGAYYDPEAHAAGWARGVYGFGYYVVPHTIQSLVRYGS